MYTAVARFYGVIDCVNGLRHSSHRCRLWNSQFRADIKWWQKFLFTFNDRSMILYFRHPVVFQTDASFPGYGAVCSDDWFVGVWVPSSLVDYSMSLYPHNWCTAGHAIDHSLCSNINFLELFPVLLAPCRWGPAGRTKVFVLIQITLKRWHLSTKDIAKTCWLCLGCTNSSGSACATIFICFRVTCLVNIT